MPDARPRQTRVLTRTGAAHGVNSRCGRGRGKPIIELIVRRVRCEGLWPVMRPEAVTDGRYARPAVPWPAR
eukprot:6876655-Prymnesium_polylepis.2